MAGPVSPMKSWCAFSGGITDCIVLPGRGKQNNAHIPFAQPDMKSHSEKR